MSERTGAVRRYLGSRKNIAGMAAALVGVGLHVAGVIGDVWPLVAAGLYGAGALVTPPEPGDEPRLTDALRSDADALAARAELRAADLPAGAGPAVRRIVDVVRLVLDRLDEVADEPADRAAAPERLAVAAEIVRVDLPACLDTYLGRAASTPTDRAVAELVAQLDLVAAAADRLAALVPDVHAQRAEDLTRELRRRYGQP
jgi:hypothetical protein